MRVSAIVPCHNAFPFVHDAVVSVLRQDWPDVEVVVVDDASSDGSAELVDLLARHLERVVAAHQPWGGAAAARNHGIERASGALLHFLDADDRALPHAYRTLAQPLLQDPSLVAAGGLAGYLSEDGRRTFGTTGQTPDPLPMEDVRAGRLVPWPPVASLVRAGAAREIGGFDAARSGSRGFPEDLDFWMRLASLGDFAVVRAVVAHYRVHGTSSSATLYEEVAEHTVELQRRDAGPGHVVQRRGRAHRHYREAGVAALNRRYARATAGVLRAAAGDPAYVLDRARRQLSRPAGPDSLPTPHEPRLRARDVEIAVVVASHNRRESTVRCLRALLESAAAAPCAVRLLWVDDGCTDGSAEAVRAVAPDVEVITGDGELYYAGAVRAAYEHLVGDPRQTDVVLLLNDDVVLHPTALAELVRGFRADVQHGRLAVLVGTTTDPVTQRVNYGGLRRRGVRLRFDPVTGDAPVECDAGAGNVLALPWPLLVHLGGPAAHLRHRWCDLDLTMRARARGWAVRTLGGVQGTCESNTSDGWWKEPGVGPRGRWRRMQHPKGLNLSEFHWFVRTHGGARGQVLHVMPYVHLARCLVRDVRVRRRPGG